MATDACPSVILSVTSQVRAIYLFVRVTTQSDAFQNGIYRTADVDQSLNMAIKTATMVLYMTEVDEVVYTETPEYGMEAELSFSFYIK